MFNHSANVVSQSYIIKDIWMVSPVHVGFTADIDLLCRLPEAEDGIIFFQVSGETVAIVSEWIYTVESYEDEERARMWGRRGGEISKEKLFEMIEAWLINEH